MSDSKPISLDRFREKKKKEAAEKKHPGIMVWLYCPKCQTIEYTEVIAPSGRTHMCGMIVEEREVELDLRAEFTIVLYNLKIIDELIKGNQASKIRKLFAKTLDKALFKLKKSEELYLERMGIKNIVPYEGDIEELKAKLPIKETNQLGLWISDFRYKPEERFKQKLDG
ncbi:MAG: hypothetical protein HOD92_04730 [Deltaproteobacteria bacterium]|jgi:hypothetical protein|nr:hypothetical protein [Deltaproteobacteria bacterium]MBT4525095.1 hypothetical protein [Deltaproteobacteria bacterium]